MYNRLLIPLDGSASAEMMLIPAKYIADKMNSTLVLIHVIEMSPPQNAHGEPHLSNEDLARQYLLGKASELEKAGYKVEFHVHETKTANVSKSIAEHIDELEVDMVFLCAHGSGGLRDKFKGNIAQQVLLHGKAPVFFAKGDQMNCFINFQINQILIALDGSPAHEKAMEDAELIAKYTNAELKIVSVVPTKAKIPADKTGVSLLFPVSSSAMLELAKDQTAENLSNLIKNLSAKAIKASGELHRGDVVSEIMHAVEQNNSDLIILGTHGRTSSDAFWAGSVTPKLLSELPHPVLLVKVEGDESVR